jgi:hypothetical protein
LAVEEPLVLVLVLDGDSADGLVQVWWGIGEMFRFALGESQ